MHLFNQICVGFFCKAVNTHVKCGNEGITKWLSVTKRVVQVDGKVQTACCFHALGKEIWVCLKVYWDFWFLHAGLWRPADDSGPDPRRSQQLRCESGPASSPVWARSEFNRWKHTVWFLQEFISHCLLFRAIHRKCPEWKRNRITWDWSNDGLFVKTF